MIAPSAGYVDKHGARTYSGLAERTLDLYRSTGDLPYIRIGRKVMFSIRDLDTFMQARRVDITNAQEVK